MIFGRRNPDEGWDFREPGVDKPGENRKSTAPGDEGRAFARVYLWLDLVCAHPAPGQ